MRSEVNIVRLKLYKEPPILVLTIMKNTHLNSTKSPFKNKK